MNESDSDLQTGYDSVAEHYATEYFEELGRKPFDRQLLDNFADEIVKHSGSGLVCELGCGPGQVARYLKIAVSICAGSIYHQKWSELRDD